MIRRAVLRRLSRPFSTKWTRVGDPYWNSVFWLYGLDGSGPFHPALRGARLTLI